MKQTEHSADWKAAAKVEIAREQVAAMIGANSDDIFFTSDANQANNLAILGIRKLGRRKNQSCGASSSTKAFCLPAKRYRTSSDSRLQISG